MKRPTLILIVFALTFFIDGLFQPLVPPQHMRAVALAHGLVIGVLCYLWCKADAFARGSVPPGRSALWAGVFPIIGVPAYFFRTRPRGAAVLGTLRAIAALVAVAILDAITAGVVDAIRT